VCSEKEASGYDEDQIKESLTAVQEFQGWETVAKGKMKSVIDNASLTDSARQTASTSISRLFHGSMRSEVVYSKKKLCSTTFQRFSSLALEVKICQEDDSSVFRKGISVSKINNGEKQGTCVQREGSASLSDCLLQQLQEEDLGAGIKKKVSFDVLPPVLVLQLKRFVFDLKRNMALKICSTVEYESSLVIPHALLSQDCITRMDKRNKSQQGVIYDLTSVICHHGLAAAAGHYTAFCKEPYRNQWKHLDDERVREVSEAEALQQSEAYLFFYSMRTTAQSQ